MGKFYKIKRTIRFLKLLNAIKNINGGLVMEEFKLFDKPHLYIGDYDSIKALLKRKIDLTTLQSYGKDEGTASIGFCPSQNKWYGWSHRAICGFGIGFIVEEGMCQDGTLPIGFEVKTLEDSKRVAISFAESVS